MLTPVNIARALLTTTESADDALPLFKPELDPDEGEVVEEVVVVLGSTAVEGPFGVVVVVPRKVADGPSVLTPVLVLVLVRVGGVPVPEPHCGLPPASREHWYPGAASENK